MPCLAAGAARMTQASDQVGSVSFALETTSWSAWNGTRFLSDPSENTLIGVIDIGCPRLAADSAIEAFEAACAAIGADGFEIATHFIL